MEFFKKVSLKDIIEDDSIFKPRRRDLLKEENMIFHTGEDGNAIGLNNEVYEGKGEEEFDYER